jgi:diguanylate cyclase (GGDEF)-like protein/PAS domain S-box-containing protein
MTTPMIMHSFRRLFGARSPRTFERDLPAPAALTDTDFRQLAENSADVIFRIGPDQIARYVSPSSVAVFGWTPEEMIGLGPHRFVHPDDLPMLMAMAERFGTMESRGEVVQFRMRRKDGIWIWVESNSQLMQDPETGRNGDLIVTMRDVTEHKKLEDQLVAMANTDGLTGLANRRAFDAELGRAWTDTLQSSGQLSLLLLDLDHFKAFNDSYGHQVGDDCLRTVARAIQAAEIGPDAFVARYGGEEIAIILRKADADRAAQVAECARRVVEELAIPHQDDEICGQITVSIGAATALARDGGTMRMPEALLASADAALYKAKRNGRNRAEVSLLLVPR